MASTCQSQLAQVIFFFFLLMLWVLLLGSRDVCEPLGLMEQNIQCLGSLLYLNQF